MVVNPEAIPRQSRGNPENGNHYRDSGDRGDRGDKRQMECKVFKSNKSKLNCKFCVKLKTELSFMEKLYLHEFK